MSIFPQLGIEYFNTKDRALIDRMNAFYSEAITLNQSYWVEADIDTRFWASEISLWSELYPNLPANRRRLFNFNRLRRIINMVSGHQRRNRKSIVAVPLENADQHTADQFTRMLLHLGQHENMLETISKCFQGALISGMNLAHVWLDYRDDPLSGTIRIDHCDYNSFMIDPYFRKTDLSDCNGVWKRTYLNRQEAISLMPQYADEIAGLPTEQGYKDGKFQYMPETYGYSYKDLLAYDEYYYKDFRKAKMLIDTQTGESMEWRSDDDERLRMYLRQYPTVKVQDVNKPTVKLGIVIQGKVFYDDVNPLGTDRYPFVPFFCYYNPQIPYYYLRVQGMIRDLRDAQYLYSRRKVIELDILESQINSGWMFKENALINPKDAFNNGQGRILTLKEEAQMTDVQQIPPPQIPPSMFQLSESLANEINQCAGVNEELLGSSNDQIAGVLSMLRQGAGLTTLEPLFDQLDESQKLLGRLLLDVMQTNYTPGKVKKIIREEPSDQFYHKAFAKYDCVVEDGLNTVSQKQMQFAQLLELRKIGVAIPDHLLLESAPLQNKNDLIKTVVQQSQQQAESAQQAQQIQLAEVQARTELAKARAVADQGLGIERVSRVQENQALAVERKAQAERDHYAAVLDFVKAIKELEGVDIANLEKLIVLARSVSQEEAVKEQQQQPESFLGNSSAAAQPMTQESAPAEQTVM